MLLNHLGERAVVVLRVVGVDDLWAELLLRVGAARHGVARHVLARHGTAWRSYLRQRPLLGCRGLIQDFGGGRSGRVQQASAGQWPHRVCTPARAYSPTSAALRKRTGGRASRSTAARRHCLHCMKFGARQRRLSPLLARVSPLPVCHAAWRTTTDLEHDKGKGSSLLAALIGTAHPSHMRPFPHTASLAL